MVSAADHAGDLGEAVLEITDDDAFSEPRSAGLHRLLVQFSEAINPMTFTPHGVLIAGNDAAGNPVDLSGIDVTTSTRSGDTVGVIELSDPLPDNVRYQVRVMGVEDLDGSSLVGDNDRVITALMGDVFQDLRVNNTDVGAVRFYRGQEPVNADDVQALRADVFVDGRVNNTDLGAVRFFRANDARATATPQVDGPIPEYSMASDSAEVIQGEPMLIDVLSNDANPQQQELHIMSAEAQHGDVAVEANMLMYMAGDYVGTDAITYTVSNGNGGMAVGTTIVNVSESSESMFQTEHFSEDSDMLASLAGDKIIDVAEGRIGNNEYNGTHEIDIGPDTGAPTATGQYVWSNDSAHAFSIVQADIVEDDSGISYTESGTGWEDGATFPDLIGYQGNYRVDSSGTGSAEWYFSNLAPSVYTVWATWEAGGQNTAEAKFEFDGTEKMVNQKSAPGGPSELGVMWEQLGEVTVEPGSGTVTVNLSNEATSGALVADAVRLTTSAYNVWSSQETLHYDLLPREGDEHVYTDLFVRTFASKAESSVTVDNLYINGYSVGDTSEANGSSGGAGRDILWIKDLWLGDQFDIQGDATFDWPAEQPHNSHLAFQIKMASVPKVNVVATNAYAAETEEDETPDVGVFTISRGERDVDGDLHVFYQLNTDVEGEVAVDGQDYSETLGGMTPLSVMIPKDQSSVTLRITPTNDSEVEWDEHVKLTIIDNSAAYRIGSQSTAMVTIFDNDGIGGLQNRNVDTESTGLTEKAIGNGTVSVNVEDGLPTLVLPMRPFGDAPTYLGDDNLHPIIPIDLLIPGSTVPGSIEATLTFAGIEAETVTFSNVDDIAMTSDMLRFVLAGPEDLHTMFGSGRFDYDVEFSMVLSEEGGGGSMEDNTYTRTVHGSTEIVNRRDAELGTPEFGQRWWLPELDRLIFDDDLLGRLTEQGKAADTGVTLVRGDGTTAWYAADPDAFEYTTIDSDDTGYYEWGHWADGTYAADGSTSDAGYNGGYRVFDRGGRSQVVWQFDDSLETGKVYQLFTTWVGGEFRESEIPYEITGAHRIDEPVHDEPYDEPIDVTLDQSYTPGEIVVDGTAWRSLGFFLLNEDSEAITITLDTDLISTSDPGRTDITADAMMLVDEWEYVTPAGSFNELDHDLEADQPFALKAKYGNEYRFDHLGLLQEHEDRNGNKTTYTYIDADADDLLDELETRTDIYNLTTTYAYDTDGYLETITDFGERVTTFTIDEDGLVTTVKEPKPNGTGSHPTMTFAYDGPDDQLSQVINARASSNQTDITYDSDNFRVTMVTNADAASWSLTPMLIDGLADDEIRLSPTGLIGEKTPEGDMMEAQATYTDARDHLWAYQVDHFGLATARANPEVNDANGSTAAGSEAVWTYMRDEHGLVLEHIEPEGAGGTLEFNDELATTYEYDENGNRTKAIYAQNEQGGGDPIEETWTYNTDNSQLTSFTDGLGRTTDYELDDRGNVEKITHPDSSIVEQYTYSASPSDPDDLPGGLVLTYTDPRGFKTETEYFETGVKLGLAMQVVAALNRPEETTVSYDYDDFRNRNKYTQHMDGGDPDRVTDYEYDDLDRLIMTQLPSAQHVGNETSRPTMLYEYDAEDLLTSQTDALGRQTQFQYDGMFRLTATIMPSASHDGTGGGPTTGSPQIDREYDANGNLVRVYDPLDRAAEYDYDERNLRIMQTLPATGDHGQSVTKYFHDSAGNVMKVTDARDKVTTYEYDKLHRRTLVALPGPGSFGSSHGEPETQIAYDDAGNVVEQVDALGRSTTYTYDELDRLKVETRPAPTAFDTPTVTQYFYDASSNLTKVTDAEGNDTQYTYDGLNRQTAIIQEAASHGCQPTTTKEYNDAGELVKVTDPLGRVTEYHYDALGRNIEIEEPRPEAGDPTPRTLLKYDKVGNLRMRRDAEHSWFEYKYDNLDRKVKEILPDPDGGGPQQESQIDYTYDIAGQMITAEDAINRKTNYQYDQQGRRIKESRPAVDEGMSSFRPDTVWKYDEVGNVVKIVEDITSTQTQTTSYQYDDLNRVAKKTEQDPGSAGNPVTTYIYDEMSREQSRTETLGGSSSRTWTFDYDNLDRRTKTTSPAVPGDSSPTTTREYDKVGNLTSETDREGRTTEYEYDDLYRLVKRTDPAAPQWIPSLGAVMNMSAMTTYEYDKVGREIEMTDALGRTTDYTYDDLDRLTKVQMPIENGSRPTYRYSYDLVGNMLSSTDAEGNVTRYRYDAQHRQTTHIAPVDDPTGTAYDTIVDDGDAGFSTTGTWTTVNTAGHDGDQLTLPATDSGDTAEWTFTGFDTGKQYEVYITWAEDPGNATAATFTVFDGDAATGASEGNFTVDQTAAPEPDIDDSGAGGSIWQLLGLFTFTDGDITVVLEDDTDTGGNENLVADAVRVVERGPATVYSYDAAGQMTKETDALGRTTTYEYDDLGRTTRVVYPDPDGAPGGAESPETLTEYDLYGNVISTTNELGETWTYEYDDLQRRTKETDPNGDSTDYEYDQRGRLTKITDPEGNSTSYEYDAWSRVIEEEITVDSNTWTRSFEYDSENNLTEKIDRNGRKFTYSYDALDRLSEEKWFDLDAMGDPTVLSNTIETTYDKQNRVVIVEDDFSKYQYDYDELDRVTSIDNAGTPGSPQVTLNSEYDEQSRRVELSASIDGTDDFKTTYTWTGRSLLASVIQTALSPSGSGGGGNAVADKRVEYAYDVADQLDTIKRYESLTGTGDLAATTSFTYDDASRLTDMVHAQGTTTLADYGWTFDSANRVTQFTSSQDGTVDYTYDDRGQLEGADYDAGYGVSDESYTYDDNGNRVTANGDSYSTGDHNRLTDDDTFDYEYDEEGNRIRRTRILSGAADDHDTFYEYDLRNRLTKVTHEDENDVVTSEVEYVYDSHNRRIAKLVDDDADGTVDKHQRYVYDGDHIALVFEDTDANGDVEADELTQRLLYGSQIDEMLAAEIVTSTALPGDVLWTLPDNLGTIRDIANYAPGSGDTTVANHLKYDAFGNIASESATSGSASVTSGGFIFAYTAREYDAETGLFYYRARYYDPAVGRFIQVDPIGFEGEDANLFRYVGNQSPNATDPTGLEEALNERGRALFTSREIEELAALDHKLKFRRGLAEAIDIQIREHERYIPLLEQYFGGETVWEMDEHGRFRTRQTGISEIVGPDVTAQGLEGVRRWRLQLDFLVNHLRPAVVADIDEMRKQRGILVGKAAKRFGVREDKIERAIARSRQINKAFDEWQGAIDDFSIAADAVPVIGNVLSSGIDFGNALVYLVRGNREQAALSGLGIIPIIGNAKVLGKVDNLVDNIQGQFGRIAEYMSDRAARYQSRITGRLPDVGYTVGGVKFDGFDKAAGVLLDAKGPGYAAFVRNGQFEPWFRGADDLVNQARRQVVAASGTRIQWHFAEEAAADATRDLLRSKGITGIDVIFTP